MTTDDVRVLIDYHYWARDRVLDAVEALTPEQLTRDMGNSFKSVLDTLAHLHASEWIWLSRWHGESPTAPLPADRFADVAAVRAGWAELETKMRGLAAVLTDERLNGFLDYRLLNGTAGRNRLWHMPSADSDSGSTVHRIKRRRFVILAHCRICQCAAQVTQRV